MYKKKRKTSLFTGFFRGLIPGALLGLVAPFLLTFVRCVVFDCGSMETPGMYFLFSVMLFPITAIIGAVIGGCIGLFIAIFE